MSAVPSAAEDTAPPEVSIVIPVYNEERILRGAVLELRERLEDAGLCFEIVLAENGSRDGTAAVAAELALRHPEVRTFSVGAPNYGRALRLGIERARGRFVVCEEIDLCDVDFQRRAVAMLERGEADMVIGSKLARGAEDERPLGRHAGSLLYNGLLRITLGFRGTDTHGLKAFRREALLPVVRACVVERDVFASELVIRAHRAGLRVAEVPVKLREKRPPSVHLWRRVPNVLGNVARLVWVIRLRRG
ncbi:MAG: glycosyltransferase family 2 protein [Polyangiaceae bacterium]|nr:glycosyltransferase family 2 protein [Polyangiaceae bacterium]